jgi:hypothetical protein
VKKRRFGVAEIVIQRRRQRSIWPWLLGLLALALLPLPFLGAGGDEPRAIGNRTTPRDTADRRDTSAATDTATARAGKLGGAAAAAGASRTTGTATGTVVPAAPSGATGTTRPAAAAPSGGASPPGAGPAVTAASRGRPTFGSLIAGRRARLGDAEHRQFTAQALRLLAEELRALGASRTGVRAIRVHADSLVMARARRGARPDYARAAFLAAVHEFDVLRRRYAASVDTSRLRDAAWAIRTDRPWLEQQRSVDAFFETANDALQSLSRAAALRRRR